MIPKLEIYLIWIPAYRLKWIASGPRKACSSACWCWYLPSSAWFSSSCCNIRRTYGRSPSSWLIFPTAPLCCSASWPCSSGSVGQCFVGNQVLLRWFSFVRVFLCADLVKSNEAYYVLVFPIFRQSVPSKCISLLLGNLILDNLM